MLLPTMAVLLLTAPPLYEAEHIFRPEAFHNHSSSIVETPGGDLIACWFHGQGERTDDTLVIRGARKRRGERSWSKPFIMADNKGLPDQNCTLFIDADGRLWLFWVSSIDNLVRSYFLKYRCSTNYEGDGPPVHALDISPLDFEACIKSHLKIGLVVATILGLPYLFLAGILSHLSERLAKEQTPR